MPLFSVSNRHIPDCGDPLEIDGDAAGFHSYFENAYGEQWLFVWSPGEAIARVYAGDFGWQAPLLVYLRERELRTPEGETWYITLAARQKRRPALILNQPEALCLLACMKLWRPGSGTPPVSRKRLSEARIFSPALLAFGVLTPAPIALSADEIDFP